MYARVRSTSVKLASVAAAAAVCLAPNSMAVASPPAAAMVGQGTKPPQIQPVKMDAPKTYTHPAGLFAIAAPGNWLIEDQIEDGVVSVTFTDPSDNAAVLARIEQVSGTPSESELIDYLAAAVDDRFGDKKKFTHTDPKWFDDGSVGMGFTYDAAVQRTAIPMTGEAYAQVDGDKLVSLLIAIVPTAQYTKLRKPLGAMLNSYKVYPDAATASGVAIGKLVLYKHPSGVFQLKVPANWKLTENNEPGTVMSIFVEPLHRALISVESVSAKQALDKAGLARAAANYVQSLHGEEDGFEAQDAENMEDGTARAVFTYDSVISGEPAGMVGAVFVRQDGKTVSFFRLLVPVDSADGLADALNEVGASLKVNRNARIP